LGALQLYPTPLYLCQDVIEKLTIIYVDNQGIIAMSKNPEYHAHSKHIAIRYYYLHQEVDARHVTFKYIPTINQAADRLTKTLGKIVFGRFINQLGLKART
jgi:sulfur transfer complex TusBCD TusB component (DsrH family)